MWANEYYADSIHNNNYFLYLHDILTSIRFYQECYGDPVHTSVWSEETGVYW